MKIYSIRHLRARRHQVDGYIQLLEDKICTDWQGMKKYLADTETMKEVTAKNIFKKVVALGLKLVAAKAVEKMLSKVTDTEKNNS